MNIEEEIKIIEEWLKFLEEQKEELYKMDSYLELERTELYKMPFGKFRNQKKIDKINQKRYENILKKRLITFVLEDQNNDINFIQFFHNLGQDKKSILTKDSYLQYLVMEQKMKEILKKMRMFRGQVNIFLKSEGKTVPMQEKELLHQLKNFSKELHPFYSYAKFTVTELVSYDSFDLELAFEIANKYDSLGQILKEAIREGYDYKKYHKIAYNFICVSYHNTQARHFIEIEEKKELESLKNNAIDVIDHNLCNKEVLFLYERKELLEYREHLLESMKDTRNLNKSTEQKNRLKLEKIDQELF